MKVLVVTPTLGTSPWLDETVASVPAGCGHALVAPADALGELRRRFPRATVIPEPGGGMYAAINAGLRAVGGWDAFTYINDDDFLLPAFADVVAALGGQERRIAYGGVRLIDARGKRLGAIPISPSPSLNRALYAQRIEPVYQHGMVVTRAAFDALGGFDATLSYCGDSEFIARACVTGVPFVRATRKEAAAFRLRPGQMTKNRAALIAERALVDQKLGLLEAPLTGAHHRARRAFRIANAPIYLERFLRHGFISFDEMLTRLG